MSDSCDRMRLRRCSNKEESERSDLAGLTWHRVYSRWHGGSVSPSCAHATWPWQCVKLWRGSFFYTWNSCNQLPDLRGDLLRAGGLSSRRAVRRMCQTCGKTRVQMTVGDDGDVSSVTVKNPRCHFFFGSGPKKEQLQVSDCNTGRKWRPGFCLSFDSD